MIPGLALLETEAAIPPIAIGLIAFGLLIALLLMTMALGKGRPHS
jgi:hypothetical protein